MKKYFLLLTLLFSFQALAVQVNFGKSESSWTFGGLNYVQNSKTKILTGHLSGNQYTALSENAGSSSYQVPSGKKFIVKGVYIRSNNGTAQTIYIYSTTDDIGFDSASQGLFPVGINGITTIDGRSRVTTVGAQNTSPAVGAADEGYYLPSFNLEIAASRYVNVQADASSSFIFIVVGEEVDI